MTFNSLIDSSTAFHEPNICLKLLQQLFPREFLVDQASVRRLTSVSVLLISVILDIVIVIVVIVIVIDDLVEIVVAHMESVVYCAPIVLHVIVGLEVQATHIRAIILPLHVLNHCSPLGIIVCALMLKLTTGNFLQEIRMSALWSCSLLATALIIVGYNYGTLFPIPVRRCQFYNVNYNILTQ